MDPQTLAARLGLDLPAVLLLVMYVADHPRLYARDRRTVVTLDAVCREEEALRAELERRVGRPLGRTVHEVDFVRDLMVLEVRFRQPELTEGSRPFTRSTSTSTTSGPTARLSKEPA
ncbi:DUF4956 domain-containing protein [Streptomyces spectabilis]|nr:DUF4956 domain-containing protein [Streptomyces spectabilis]